MSCLPRHRPLSDRQRLFLEGLPSDGSWVERGSSGHTTASALLARGLVRRRYDPKGSRFHYARVLNPPIS